MKGSPIDMSGRVIDKLTVLRKVRSTPSGSVWECMCTCGQMVEKQTTQLRRVEKNLGKTGCRSCETISRSDAKTIHGGAKLGKSPVFNLWRRMRTRCSNPKNTSFKYYGGKGISVDPVWDDFSVFRAWAEDQGYTEGMSIDRINPEGNYCPENCEIVTRSENSKRMVAYNRQKKAAMIYQGGQ